MHLNLTLPHRADPRVPFTWINAFPCQIFPQPVQLVDDAPIKVFAHSNSLLSTTDILVSISSHILGPSVDSFNHATNLWKTPTTYIALFYVFEGTATIISSIY